MMKKILNLLCAAAFSLSILPATNTQISVHAAEFIGAGTADEPYQIATKEDLFKLAEFVNNKNNTSDYASSYYIQTADIDLNNEKWEAIGTLWIDGVDEGVCFLGQYNGNYHKILNLNCDDADNHCGLFGRIGVSGDDFTGKCIIKNLSVFGTVKSEGYCAGGIVGEICSGASVENCSFNGDVYGKWCVGGIAGMTYDGGNISYCYHNGNVYSESLAGGIIGNAGVGNTGTSQDTTINNCYSAGKEIVANNGKQGGIAGNYEILENKIDSMVTFENNYYLSTLCTGAVNGENMIGCTKLSSVALKACADMLGFPFVDNNEIDNINDGYPIFEWQSTPYQFKGSGTEDDPFQISNRFEIKIMRDLINSPTYGWKYCKYSYSQTADIDLENEKWIPIGKHWKNTQGDIAPFCGHYNGNGYSIYNLNVNESTKFSGLFGCLHTVGIIENLEVHGNVNSTAPSTGGIVGELCSENGIVRNCCFFGDVKSSDNAVGGIVGYLWQSGMIQNCYHNGQVIGSEAKAVGGIAGQITVDGITNVSLENCYHVGNVIGDVDKSGSIVGIMDGNEEREGNIFIRNCYSINGNCQNTSNGNSQECNILVLTPSLLKLIAEDLGSAYVKNQNNNFNEGYPIFTWQSSSSIKGDLNRDGDFNISDIILLQKWLLRAVGIEKFQETTIDRYSKLK